MSIYVDNIDEKTIRVVQPYDLNKNQHLYNFDFYLFMNGLFLNHEYYKMSYYLRNKYKLKVNDFLGGWKQQITSFIGVNGLNFDIPPKKNLVVKRHFEIINEVESMHPTFNYYNEVYIEKSHIMSSIATHIQGGYVVIPRNTAKPIMLNLFTPKKTNDDSIQPELDIVIMNALTKRQLIKNIQLFWPKIKEKMDLLPKLKKIGLTHRDLFIVSMREENSQKYRETADDLEENKYHYDEDVVKMAYHRAKKKINRLFTIRNKTLK